MARKSNTKLQEQGKVRGITNKEIDYMKETLKHFSFKSEVEDTNAPKD